MVLSFPMFNIYPLTFIAFIPMALIVYSNIKFKRLFFSFAVFVFVFFGILLFWVAAFMLKSAPLYVAIVSVLFILVALSMFYTLTAVVAKVLIIRFPKIRWLILPSCFAILEYMRTVGFLGFPWGLIGYSQWKFIYFIQIADLFGVIGVGFVLYLANSILADIICKYYENRYTFYQTYMKFPGCFTNNLMVLIILFVLIFSYGIYQINGRYYEYNIAMKKVDIAMVQKSFDPNHVGSAIYTGEPALQGATGFRKFIESLVLNPDIFVNEETPDGATQNSMVFTTRMANLAKEAAKENPSMIVFCESALRSSYQYYEPSIAENISNMDFYKISNPSFYNVYTMYDAIVSTGSYYLLGSSLIYPNTNTNTSGRYTYYNGANFIGTNGSIIEVYGKIKLVPFGEAYPFQDSKFFRNTPPFSYLINFIYKSLESANVAGWGKWHDTTVFEHPTDDYTFSTPICYESAFGDFTRHFVKNGAGVIITITEDAWSYKDSSLWQHFTMGVFRAIENRRDFLQNGNSGVTGHIDAFGHVIYTMEEWKPGYSVAEVKINESTTIYTKYGEWFVILIAIFLALLFTLTTILIIINKSKEFYTFAKGQVIIVKYKIEAKVENIKKMANVQDSNAQVEETEEVENDDDDYNGNEYNESLDSSEDLVEEDDSGYDENICDIDNLQKDDLNTALENDAQTDNTQDEDNSSIDLKNDDINNIDDDNEGASQSYQMFRSYNDTDDDDEETTN